MPRRRIVLVLGMHRSGTSLCANMLARLGVDMADAPGASPENARGHWERPRINDLHDEALAILGRSWADEAHHLALPEGWPDDPRLDRVRDALATWLRPRLDSTALFGFKDPRTSRLLPLWPRILERLDADPVFIFCVRDPAQVARSVASRDSFAHDQAEYRWLVYNANAVHALAQAPVCVVPYESWFATPDETITRLATFIGLATPPDAECRHSIVAETLDLRLRHDATNLPPVRPAAGRLHTLLLHATNQPCIPQPLHDLAETIGLVEQSCLPMLRDAVSARVGMREQARVIGDLNGLIGRMRKEESASF